MILTGICGFAKAQARVFRELPLVEIQQTFYRPVAVATARRWRERAPKEFLFTVKASQFITHEASSPTYRRSGLDVGSLPRDRYGGFRDTGEVRAGWAGTRQVAEALDARAIVFQTPASFGPTPENLRNLYRFFEPIRNGPRTLAWDPRGGWPGHIVEKACADLGLVHCVDPFAGESATIGLAYFRLHGRPPGERMYDYTYTDDDLNRLRDIAREYDDAYVLFNNVTMFEDAVRFRGATDVHG